MSADLTPAGSAAVRLADALVRTKKQRDRARDLACAYEAQLAKVHAICAEWHKCIPEPNRRPGWSGGAILHDIEKALQVRDE